MAQILGLFASVLLVLVLSVVRHRVRYALKANARGCKTPKNFYPTRDPFLGLDVYWKMLKAEGQGRYLEFVTNRFRRYGNTFVARRLLFDVIHTIDADNLKHVLSTDFYSFRLSSTRVNGGAPILGRGIFLSDGPEWAHARALIRPAFNKTTMDPLLRLSERHFQFLIRRFPLDGSTFDLYPLFLNFATDTSTEFLFGRSAHTLDPDTSNEPAAQFIRDFSTCVQETLRRARMGPFNITGLGREAIKARDRSQEYISQLVDEALQLHRGGKLNTLTDDTDIGASTGHEDGKARYNLLLEIARDTDDRNLLRDQVSSILLASRGTIAAFLANVFFLLARHPDVYQELQQEVRETLNGEIPSWEQLKNIKYLRYCLNETLRLYPPVASNDRQAVKDTFLPVGGGPDGSEPIFIPKGTRILFYPYSMHRREDVFGPDTDDFKPERWEGLRPGWGFLPFHGGPRACPGQQFALAEISYVICRFVQQIGRIEPRDDRPYQEIRSLNLRPGNGVHVALNAASDV